MLLLNTESSKSFKEYIFTLKGYKSQKPEIRNRTIANSLFRFLSTKDEGRKSRENIERIITEQAVPIKSV